MINSILIAFSTLVLFWMFIAGAIMLFTPKRWTRLPDWISLRGSVRPSITKTVFGRLQVRIVGLALSLFSVTVLAGIFGYPIAVAGTYSFGWETIFVQYRTSLVLLTYGFVLVCGLVMLFNPTWWIRRFYVRPSKGRVTEDLPGLNLAVRLCSLLFIGAALYAGIQCIVRK